MAAYARLGAAQQAELQKRILVFLNEKTFEGCLELEITDTVRVGTAAQACLLELVPLLPGRRERLHLPHHLCFDLD